MAYSLVRSQTLSKTMGNVWKEYDISSYTLSSIFNSFSKVYLELTHANLSTNIYVDLDIFRADYSNYINSLSSFLINIGNTPLTTVEYMPMDRLKSINTKDVFQAQYKVLLSNDSKDVDLTRPKYNTDLSLIDTDCLVSVNGYIHPTSYINNTLKVIGAGDTLNRNKIGSMSILSFNDISTLSKQRLTTEKLNKDPSIPDYYDNVWITSDVSLLNKGWFLVLGGYIIMPAENVLWTVSDTQIALSISQLSFVEKIFESHSVMDLSSTGLTIDPQKPDILDVDEIRSDAFIENYLLDEKTFIVTLSDVDQITYIDIPIRRSSFPGELKTYQEPKQPLLVNYGRMGEYWKQYNDKVWTLRLIDNYLKDHILDYYYEPSIGLVNHFSAPNNLKKESKTWLLDIKGFTYPPSNPTPVNPIV